MRQQSRLLSATLLAIFLCGAVRAVAATTAASLTADITVLSGLLAQKHGVVDHGDYSWLDSTDYDAVYDLYDEYELYLRKNPAGPPPMNAWRLEQMRAAVDAATTALENQLAQAQEIQAQFEHFTEENYSEAAINAANALRGQVNATAMDLGFRTMFEICFTEIDNAVKAVRGRLLALSRELKAVRPEELRFDKTQGAAEIIARYKSSSADARAYMDCGEQAQRLAARLLVLEEAAAGYATLRDEVAYAAGLAQSYESRAAILLAASRCEAQDDYVREKLEAELGAQWMRFWALHTYLEGRARAVQSVGALLEKLPERSTILRMDDEKTAACRVQAMQALAAYGALYEDAERAELFAQKQRLDDALASTASYLVTAKSGAHGTATAKSPVYYGKECVVRVVPEPGWRVGRVQAGANTLRPVEDGWAFTVTADAAVTVEFVRQRFPVEAAALCPETGCNAYGEAVVQGEVDYGASAVVKALPEDSHVVESITATVDGTPVPVKLRQADGCVYGTVEYVTGRTVFTVTFAPRMFTVQTMCLPQETPHGEVSPGGSVRWGGAYTGTAVPAQGYRTHSVLADGAEIPVRENSFTIYDIRSDVTVQVRFERVPGKAPSGGGGSGGGTALRVPSVEAEREPKANGGYTVSLTPGQATAPQAAQEKAQAARPKEAPAKPPPAQPEPPPAMQAQTPAPSAPNRQSQKQAENHIPAAAGLTALLSAGALLGLRFVKRKGTGV